MWKHYVLGVIASGISGFISTFLSFSRTVLGLTFCSIPFGLIAGFIGGKLEEKYPKSKRGKFIYVILTIIFGIFLPWIPFIVLWLIWLTLVILTTTLSKLTQLPI